VAWSQKILPGLFDCKAIIGGFVEIILLCVVFAMEFLLLQNLTRALVATTVGIAMMNMWFIIVTVPSLYAISYLLRQKQRRSGGLQSVFLGCVCRL